MIVGAQRALLDAAVEAGVPRFTPSDYSIDFTKLPPGNNRNLDLRREFHTALDRAAIAPTTIFSGAFTDLVVGQAPIILFKLKRVVVLRAGGLKRLERLIALTRLLAPGRDDVYPPWQGMQYLRDMFDGRGKLEPLDNHRYPQMTWTPTRSVLAARRA